MSPEAPTVLNRDGPLPGLIVVDHAGAATPCDLGLHPDWRGTHQFCDLGVADLGRALAARLAVPVVLCNVSRLVIDVNRWIDDPRSILADVDDVPIPGNQSLTAADRLARQEAVFWPYHTEIGRIWAQQRARHARPFFLALHSCTRVFDGVRRPWDGGTIWNDSADMSSRLLAALGTDPALTLGDNQPYSGRAGVYCVDRHCYGTGLPACGFEVSNDGLETPAGCDAWADRLAQALQAVMDEDRA